MGARYNCVPANLCALSPSRGRQTFEMSRIQVLFGVAVPLMTLSGIAVALRLVTHLRSYISWNAADLAWWKCRFYCRRFIVRRVGPDDWVMLVALVCSFDFLGPVGLLLTWMAAEHMGYRSVPEIYTAPCTLARSAFFSKTT